MIGKLTEASELKFKNLTPEYKKQRGVLCRLYGPIASCTLPTRNGRRYSEPLWEKLFQSDLIIERFQNGGIFGQLGHPEYEEVDMEKVACVMPEPPVKDKSGNLIAYIDIIDSPCGRVAYQLAKYGYKFGISSRGTGDLIPSDDGENDEVDPETYQLNAFDLVEIPAVSTARLAFVESLEKKNKKTLKQVLKEELEKASDEDKKLMEEVLGAIGLTDEAEQVEDAAIEELEAEVENEEELVEEVDSMSNPGQQPKDKEDKEEEDNTTESGESRSDIDQKEVVDDKSEDPEKELVAEFKEALRRAKSLEKDNLSLKEELSVCHAKEVELSEQLVKYKQATIRLSDSAKEAKVLKEDLNKKDNLLKSSNTELKRLRLESRTSEKKSRMTEAKLAKSTDKLEELRDQVEKLTETIEKTSKQLEDSKVLLEKYKRSYKNLKEHYLEVKASSCGLQKEEVVSKLNESYKIKDIDLLCEELGDVKRNLEKLPFTINENAIIRIKPSNEHIEGYSKEISSDDYVSDTLRMLANLK